MAQSDPLKKMYGVRFLPPLLALALIAIVAAVALLAFGGGSTGQDPARSRQLNELVALSQKIPAQASGALAGKAGDRWSLGFVAETEQQVVQHLNAHLERLPTEDRPSQAILEQMREDEARHAADALAAGGARLPLPVRALMRGMSKVMTQTTYWV